MVIEVLPRYCLVNISNWQGEAMAWWKPQRRAPRPLRCWLRLPRPCLGRLETMANTLAEQSGSERKRPYWKKNKEKKGRIQASKFATVILFLCLWPPFPLPPFLLATSLCCHLWAFICSWCKTEAKTQICHAYIFVWEGEELGQKSFCYRMQERNI